MSRNLKAVMDEACDEIQKDLTAGLDIIKKIFETKGLPFDEKFRKLFCKSISNRMAEVFDIFEMENAMGTWKRHRLISNESTDSKRRKCDNEILPKWAFTCAHCYSQNGQNHWFSSEKEVHQHWQHEHSKAKLTFRFHVDHTVQCYRCGLVGFFEQIQTHVRVDHKEFPVLIKNKCNSRDRECAFCNCNGNIPEHYRRVHSDEITSIDALNLISLTYSNLKGLGAIEKQELRCSYCKRSYGKKADFDQHHRAKHPGKQQKIDGVKLICCFCDKSIQSDFLVHVKECGIFKCNKCQQFHANTAKSFLNHVKEMHSNDLGDGFCSKLRRSLMDEYSAMKCVFKNGLVVTQRSLFSRTVGDSKEFNNLIAESFDEMRTLIKRSKI